MLGVVLPLVGSDGVAHHLRVGVDAGVAGGEEVLHGADVVDGHVQDVDLGQLLALAAPGEHRVRDLLDRRQCSQSKPYQIQTYRVTMVV